MKKTFLALSIFGAISLTVNATVFYGEDFSYSDGALTNVAADIWFAHSGGGSVPVMVSSEEISLVQGGGSREDVNRPTGSTLGAGETWYAGFDVTVSGGSTTTYFAHFLAGTSFFGTRVFVTAPTGGGDFSFGIGSSSSPQSVWATGLSFDTPHRLVVSYDYDTGDGYLWVDPTQQTDTSIYTTNFIGNAFTSYAFRQSSGDSVEVIDNLVVGTSFNEVLTIPEPSVFAVGAIGLVALAVVRRRR